ncbi:origin recognition complex subunit 1 [Microplitis mediator]|uniref:origin recognition complex subunit 1 n=1 Tax=Microplitis mediator TaxID=375433 RepID=UPI002552FDF8|nr:origin recognition complex subunit 1 [Microplitis mediator]XP_057333289.1 origin recognition complex subunit 1 [Microplitis mediator]XP_057333290.1 origin recognition complex subunit 1 [Microplitis mediator]XP_057333291.1 origin recognition complex subunit 1 [Microplitis mediator]
MPPKRQSTYVSSDDDVSNLGIRETRSRCNKSLVTKSPSKTIKIANEPEKPREGGIIVKIRRSTEQSQYKCEIAERRASLRTSISTPVRYRDASSSQSPVSKSPKYKTRSACAVADRMSGLKISEDKENESDDLDSSLELFKPKMQRTQRAMTPSKITKLLEEAPETPRLRGLRTPVKKAAATPKRLKEIVEEVTPRRKSKAPATPKSAKAPATPKGTPRNLRFLTPSMKSRTAGVSKPVTVLEKARAQLHVSAVPKSLPCRDQEFNDIFMFLEKKITDGSSGCMYISGVPGTGKTATVNEVIRCLRKLTHDDRLPPFKCVEINGMKLSEPRQAYVQILKQLTGKSTTWEEAHKALDKRFTGKRSKGDKDSITLLVIDELDVLCNKRQDVVYNLLNWPSQQAAQLVVITIANTMDLPERVLMSRVTSRLGLTRLTFQPYNFKQLHEIVITRLNESDAFKSDAIQLVARKVAAVSGDARRALDICRRATEIAEMQESKIVGISHVNEALTEMIASVKVRAIKHCSEMERVFLQAVCAEITRTGVEETTFINVYKQLEALCSFEGVASPNITQALGICNRLSAFRLIICDEPRCDIMQRLFLNVSSDDVHYALQNVDL